MKVLQCLCLLLCSALAQSSEHPSTILADGVGHMVRFSVVLPSPDIQAVAPNQKHPLMVIIDRRQALSGDDQTTPPRWRYHLRAMAFEPGLHQLSPWLLQRDGQPVTSALPMLQVPSLLGEVDHWDLQPNLAASSSPRGLPYQSLLISIATLWVLAGLLWWWWHRPPAQPRPTPSSDPLPALLRAAADNRLDSAAWAEVEQRLLRHWREQLGGDEAAPSLVAAIAQLRRHPHFGPLLRNLEQGLHSEQALDHALQADRLLAAPSPAADQAKDPS